MENQVFCYPILIREYHLDTFGHVNNATYLQMMEEARWEFVTSRGFGLNTIREKGMGPIILECNIKFLKEIRLRESIVIECETLSYDKKIGRLAQRIINEKREICCEAEMVFGLFDLKQRTLISPTPEWLYAIGMS